MRAGDLVKVRRHGPGRPWALCVALPVTRKDIRAGINAKRPGLHLFRGYWYGSDPLSIASYGKIEGRAGRVVGRLRSHFQAASLHL